MATDLSEFFPITGGPKWRLLAGKVGRNDKKSAKIGKNG
jgi:hypothetical protein